MVYKCLMLFLISQVFADEASLVQSTIRVTSTGGRFWFEPEMNDEEAHENEPFYDEMETGVSNATYYAMIKKAADYDIHIHDTKEDAAIHDEERDARQEVKDAEDALELAVQEENKNLPYEDRIVDIGRQTEETVELFKGKTNAEREGEIQKLLGHADTDAKREVFERNLKTEVLIDPNWVCDLARDGSACNHRSAVDDGHGTMVDVTLNKFGQIIDGPLELMFPGEDIQSGLFIQHNQVAIQQSAAKSAAKVHNLAKRNYKKMSAKDNLSPAQFYLMGGFNHIFDQSKEVVSQRRHTAGEAVRHVRLTDVENFRAPKDKWKNPR